MAFDQIVHEIVSSEDKLIPVLIAASVVLVVLVRSIAAVATGASRE